MCSLTNAKGIFKATDHYKKLSGAGCLLPYKHQRHLEATKAIQLLAGAGPACGPTNRHL